MELINENLIKINMDFSNKDEVLNTVSNILDKENRLIDKEIYLRDVYAREEEGPTALGFSFAVPHAKSRGVKQASLVFVEMKNEISWANNEKIKYVFGIAVPSEQAGDEHLQIISKLARKMMNEDFRRGLVDAKSKEEYLTLIMSE